MYYSILYLFSDSSYTHEEKKERITKSVINTNFENKVRHCETHQKLEEGDRGTDFCDAA